jgi:hypothetical protein
MLARAGLVAATDRVAMNRSGILVAAARKALAHQRERELTATSSTLTGGVRRVALNARRGGVCALAATAVALHSGGAFQAFSPTNLRLVTVGPFFCLRTNATNGGTG